MRVALCTRNAENPVVLLLKDRLASKGHRIEILTDPRQLDDPRTFDAGFWRPDSRNLQVAAFARQVPMVLEGLGVPFVNSLDSCDRASNKLVSGRLFEAAGIATPATAVVPQPWESGGMPALPSGSVIAKPIEGKASRGVRLFPSAEAALSQLGSAGQAYLLQQPINWTQLLRIVVAQSGVVRGFTQENPDREEPTISRVNGTWPAPNPKVPEDAEAMALAMLGAVGGDFMRADILRDNSNEIWALEINASFGFPHGDEVILREFSRQFDLASSQRHALS